MAARPTRIVADVRLWSVCGSSSLRRRDYIRRPQLLTHYATGRRQAHLTKGYSPKWVEQEFCELRVYRILGSSLPWGYPAHTALYLVTACKGVP
jgi:hypothetical protein